MKLRQPTDEEKKLLLDYYIEHKYVNPPSEEERRDEAEWVEQADIAVFDYSIGCKTMVVLWDKEPIYTETYTIRNDIVERAFLDQAWFLVDEVVDKKIDAMIEAYERAILQIITDNPNGLTTLSLKGTMARMDLRHNIVELTFQSEKNS